MLLRRILSSIIGGIKTDLTSEVILREKVNSEASRFVDMARCFQAVSEKLWEHLVKGTVVMPDDYKHGHGLSH